MRREDLSTWLQEYNEIKQANEIPDSLIFNCDETMIASLENKLKVITKKNSVRPVNSFLSKAREHVTLLLGSSASGEKLPHLLLFPLVNVPPLDDVILNNFSMAGSAKGWMTAQIFKNMVTNHYVPAINQIRVRLGVPNSKVLLLFDGSTTHFAVDHKQLFEEHGIILKVFPPHSSAILQPLDLGPNGSLKNHISKNFEAIEGESLADHRNRMLHCVRRGLTVAMSDHMQLVGWEASGLVPYNPSKPLGSSMVRTNPVLMPAPKRKVGKDVTNFADGRIVLVGDVSYPVAPVASIVENTDDERPQKERRVVTFSDEFKIKIKTI